MEKKARVVKTGNSLAVVIPAPFVRKLGIQASDQVIVKTNYPQGIVTYTFPNIRQLSLV